ncbi:MAG: substrate-binding domain-containing protein [Sulfolobus sp.]|nr:substrate-binding domain-containing protein [Sulfolobus sp.]
MDLTLEGFNVLEDLWGKASGIRVFMAGNQWFVLPDLIFFLNSKGFDVFIESLPPGAVRRHVLGEPIKIGNLILDFKPDITSLPPPMLNGINYYDYFEYVTNDLVIVYNGSEYKDWCDLKGKEIAIPNPETEGIGQMFKDLYEMECGKYNELVSSGLVHLTKIHHREIPKMLKENKIEAGVVWKTEALYWKFKYVEPKVNSIGKLAFALLNNSERVKAMFDLLKSEDVKRIYEKYGFKWIA